MDADAGYDIVTVGGGIAGSALATVLARQGLSVLVLERQESFADRVRGEWIAPWGVGVAAQLGLLDELTGPATRACVQNRVVFYDENLTPAQAEAGALDLSVLLPGVGGGLDIGHPEACEALARAASGAGAQVRRGISHVEVTPGRKPSVTFVADGREHQVRPRLVVGADGRNSTVRHQLGLTLDGDPAPTIGAGLLVDGLDDWPAGTSSRGTAGRVGFFVFPRADGRARLYLEYPLEDAARFSGPHRSAAFLAAFDLPCLPAPERFAKLTPAGPCAGYPWRSTWTDTTVVPGVVLVGDAGGYNNPTIGQGLSLTLKDVASLADCLGSGEDWSPEALAPYDTARRTRMERARGSALLISALFAQYGPEAAARRAAVLPRARSDQELMMPIAAQLVGYEAFPPEAFGEELRNRILTLA